MITLDIDSKKVITLAMVPFVPSEQVMQMSAGVKGDFDKVKMIVQLQILSYPELNVLSSAMLSLDELKTLLHLGRAIGMSVDGVADILDVKFDDYRKIVQEKGRKK